MYFNKTMNVDRKMVSVSAGLLQWVIIEEYVRHSGETREKIHQQKREFRHENWQICLYKYIQYNDDVGGPMIGIISSAPTLPLER